MTETLEQLKHRIQARLPEPWHVFHAQPYGQANQLTDQGNYKAHRRLPNGSMVIQHGDTPDELVASTKAYEAEYAQRVAPASPRIATGVVTTTTETERS